MVAPVNIAELVLGVVFNPASLGILAVAGIFMGVYTLKNGLGLILGMLSGQHTFGGQVWTRKQWEEGMKAVHDAKRRGQFVDSESWNAYQNYMNPNRKRSRNRVRF